MVDSNAEIANVNAAGIFSRLIVTPAAAMVRNIMEGDTHNIRCGRNTCLFTTTTEADPLTNVQLCSGHDHMLHEQDGWFLHPKVSPPVLTESMKFTVTIHLPTAALCDTTHYNHN